MSGDRERVTGEPEGAAPEPVYKAVERILDEESAWIARPNKEVTRRVALAATIAAHHIIEEQAKPLPADEVDGVVEPKEYPYVRAAFINAIAEEGTKAEAVEWLQKEWNARMWWEKKARTLASENDRLTERLNRAHLDCAKYLGELAVLRAALGGEQ